MGKDNEILKRLRRIERKQDISALDKVFLLTVPAILLLTGYVIEKGVTEYTLYLMLFLSLFLLPIATYLVGIWKNSLRYRRTAWSNLLFYGWTYGLGIFFLSVPFRLISAHLGWTELLVALLLMVGYGAMVAFLYIWSFVGKILPTFTKIDRSLRIPSLEYAWKRVRRGKKYVIFYLVLLVLVHIVLWVWLS